MIGISISSAVIQYALRNRLRTALLGYVDLDTIIGQVRESLESIDRLDPKVQAIVRKCYEYATQWSFVVDFFLVMGAIAMGLCIQEKRLSG